MVTDGKLMSFSEQGDNEIYEEGAILGVEQFLFNKTWDVDVICGATAVVAKLKWDNLLDMVKQNALSASRAYKCVVRHFCFSQLYDSGKKIQNQPLFNHAKLSDEDLMIDFKLSLKDDRERHLFNLLSQARQGATEKVREPKGQEIDTMPYFLSSEFAAIIENKNALDEKLRAEAAKNKSQATSSSSSYKSQFLKEKLLSQNDKRKLDRKKPKENLSEEGKENAGPKAKMVKKKGPTDEDLVDIIDELREDLRNRDQEYEQLRSRMEKLEALNTHLAEKLHQSKMSHIADTATLNNIRNVKEIQRNFDKINQNRFFTGINDKSSRPQAVLLDSVREQLKSSSVQANVAKCAMVWLEKVRKKRAEREKELFFKD